jgi:hypothetical protein
LMFINIRYSIPTLNTNDELNINLWPIYGIEDIINV